MLTVLRKTRDFFTSIRLAIVLLTILSAVSLIGIVIPQGLHPEQYLHRWGQPFGTFLLFLGFNRVFSASWFYLILFILSCNILACSATRFWKTAVTPPGRSFPGSTADVLKYRHSMTFTSQTSCIAARDRITALLKHRLHFSVLAEPRGEGGFQIAARKGIAKDIGSFIFHLSMVLLFLGGIIGSRFGYSEIRNLRAGEIVSVAKRDFLIRCDWFKLEENEDKSPKAYKSKVAVLLAEDSSVILEKTIAVNDPLSYRGIKIYQASYGIDPEGVISVNTGISGPGLPETGWTGDVPYKTRFPIPGTGIQVMVTDFIPDFAIDMATRKAFSRSENPNNPAVKISLANDDSTVFSRWAFFNFPGQHAGNDPYKVNAVSYEPQFYTGLQIRDNPGVPLIWLAIILMTFGIFAVFYIARKTLWVFVEPCAGNTGASTITIGGTSSRTQQDFQGDFETICGRIKESLTQEA